MSAPPPDRHRWRRRLALVALAVGAAFLWLLYAPGPLATQARAATQAAVNGYLDALRVRGAQGQLTALDRGVLHTSVVGGSYAFGLQYPEGAKVLRHAVYGGGAPLEVDASYFARSPVVAAQVARLGPGTHGPLWVRAGQDFRLTLTFNGYYLKITDDRVRLFHPDMTFAPAAGHPVPTIVPLGKLRFRVPDNLVSAMGSRPFYCWSEWAR